MNKNYKSQKWSVCILLYITDNFCPEVLTSEKRGKQVCLQLWAVELLFLWISWFQNQNIYCSSTSLQGKLSYSAQ